MTNDGINTLVYDAENHAVSATNGSAAGAYVYDGDGLRVRKCAPNCSSPTVSTVYVFSGSKVIAEYDNGASPSSPSREYVYSGAALIAKIDSSGTKYYQQDHLSNRLVTDSSGNTLGQMGTFPYGESWYNASNDKLLFTTYERDSESGNDYAQARYNVSGLGRFSSPDPVAGNTSDPQSLNRYSYVRNMPIQMSDPGGTCPPTVKNWDPDGSQPSESGHGPNAPSDDVSGPEPQQGDCNDNPWYPYLGFGGGWEGNGGVAGLDGGYNGDDSGFGVGSPLGGSGGGGIGGPVFVPFQSWTFLGAGVYNDVPGTFWSVADGVDIYDYFSSGNGSGGGGGGGPLEFLKLLGNCTVKLYGVLAMGFVPSQPGVNGSFVGSELLSTEFPSHFTVTNNVQKYTIQTLQGVPGIPPPRISPDGLHMWTAQGFTDPQNPYENFTASNSPQMQFTQLVELGNSLQAIINAASVPQMVQQDRTFDNEGLNNSPGRALVNCIDSGGK